MGDRREANVFSTRGVIRRGQERPGWHVVSRKNAPALCAHGPAGGVALADYNAGRSNVLRWNKGAASTNSALFLQQMDFPGTREYIRSILKRKPRYEGQFAART
jgi:hypothetical protein